MLGGYLTAAASGDHSYLALEREVAYHHFYKCLEENGKTMERIEGGSLTKTEVYKIKSSCPSTTPYHSGSYAAK